VIKASTQQVNLSWLGAWRLQPSMPYSTANTTALVLPGAGKDELQHLLNLATGAAAGAKVQQQLSAQEQQQGLKPHLCVVLDCLTPLLQRHTPHQVARFLVQLQSHPRVSCILAAVHTVRLEHLPDATGLDKYLLTIPVNQG
jgi:hypothetical protein